MTISAEQFDMLEQLKGGLPEGDFCCPDIEEEYAIDEPAHVSSGKTLSVSVVSVMAYLIGVNEEYFGKQYKRSVFDELETRDEARIIRALSIIRTAVMRNTGAIYSLLHQEIRNLDSIPEFIDPELFTFLASKKIRIVTGAKLKDMTEYIALVNTHISNCINACAKLFPAWVRWEYVKDLFIMPGGTKKDKAQSAADRMKANLNSYPFGCYINWPIERDDAFMEDPESSFDTVTTGNVILNDKKFMVLLYRISGDEFTDFYRVYDADSATVNCLTDWMTEHDGITLLVDCENSDPYRLCALFDSMKEIRARYLREKRADDPMMGCIKKIILFDDYHTVDAWDVLTDYINVPIEHQEIERVLGHKSLVDIAMTAGACKERYVNGVTSFMIASSDSDYWGLMRAMPDCSFIVLGERSKISPQAQRFYGEHSIPVCLIDDFAGDISKIKEGSLRHCLEKHLNNLISLNLTDALEDIYGGLRLDMSSQERDNFRSGLTKTLKLEIGDRGDLRVRIAV